MVARERAAPSRPPDPSVPDRARSLRGRRAGRARSTRCHARDSRPIPARMSKGLVVAVGRSRGGSEREMDVGDKSVIRWPLRWLPPAQASFGPRSRSSSISLCPSLRSASQRTQPDRPRALASSSPLSAHLRAPRRSRPVRGERRACVGAASSRPGGSCSRSSTASRRSCAPPRIDRGTRGCSRALPASRLPWRDRHSAVAGDGLEERVDCVIGPVGEIALVRAALEQLGALLLRKARCVAQRACILLGCLPVRAG